MDQTELDSRIQAYYGGAFDEDARLSTRSAQGPLEFDRVQRLVASTVAPRSRVLDIGGGAGAHAVALRDAGHDVAQLSVDADRTTRDAAARLAEVASAVPGIRDFSGHLIAVARVKDV